MSPMDSHAQSVGPVRRWPPTAPSHLVPEADRSMRVGKAFHISGTTIAGLASVSWRTEQGRTRSARATSELLHEPMTRNQPSRRPSTHPLKRNTEGHYWFEQTGHHVWHESMEEYTALMFLDHSEDVAGICTQPLRFDFADGTHHYPDAFLQLRDGRQVVCNIRPAALVDEAAVEQFAKTADACAQIGWSHRLIVDVPLTYRHNLDLLAAYRHHRNLPDDTLADALLGLVNEPTPFGALWAFTQRTPGPTALAGLYNLIWHRELCFDMTAALAMNTLVWRP